MSTNGNWSDIGKHDPKQVNVTAFQSKFIYLYNIKFDIDKNVLLTL